MKGEHEGTIRLDGLGARYRVGWESGCVFQCSEDATCASCYDGYTLTIEVASSKQADAIIALIKNGRWHSPYEAPGFCGASARRVLVKIERRDNPPALNAPPRYTFGHHIPNANGSPAWPEDGWFFDGQRDDDERVVAWRYIETPED